MSDKTRKIKKKLNTTKCTEVRGSTLQIASICCEQTLMVYGPEWEQGQHLRAKCRGLLVMIPAAMKHIDLWVVNRLMPE